MAQQCTVTPAAAIFSISKLPAYSHDMDAAPPGSQSVFQLLGKGVKEGQRLSHLLKDTLSF